MWEWVKNIMTTSVETWATSVNEGIDGMTHRLGAETEIRIYVDNTPNYGNQASSVLLMKTLIDQYGYNSPSKTVTILYKENGAVETKRKLSILLEGFDYTNPNATTKYRDVTINFMTIEALNKNPDIGNINFGFAGGADKGDGGDEKTDNWFGKACKVNYFLRLQAYLWPYPQQIQFGAANSGVATFDLNANVGNGGTFEKTGWYIIEQYWQPTQEDWSYYQDVSNPGVDAGTVARTNLADVLVRFITEHPGALKLMPVYGIKEFPNQTGVVPWASLSTVVATALGGSKLLPGETPTVVVSLNDDIEVADFTDAYYVSRAKETQFEIDATDSLETAETNKKEYEEELAKAQAEDVKNKANIAELEEDLKIATVNYTLFTTIAPKQKQAYTQRKSWLNARNSPDGITFASSKTRMLPNPAGSGPEVDVKVDPSGLSAALTTLTNPNTSKPAILFLELGPLPTILFNCIFSLASFPQVFEGANSANLALNLGTCYLRMQDPNKASKTNRYPDAWALKSTAYTYVHHKSINAADAVTNALNSSCRKPALQFDDWMKQSTNYINDYYVDQDVNLLSYYQKIKEFYHNQTNDKLGIGLSCLNQAVINYSSGNVESVEA